MGEVPLDTPCPISDESTGSKAQTTTPIELTLHTAELTDRLTGSFEDVIWDRIPARVGNSLSLKAPRRREGPVRYFPFFFITDQHAPPQQHQGVFFFFTSPRVE